MAKSTKKDPVPTANQLDDILGEIQSDLNKLYGVGTAARLSEPGITSKVDDWVSTRSIVVDSVLRGGRPKGSSLVPFGRQMEISGLNGAGKSSLCAQIAAEVQSQGGIAIVVDTEERIDEPYWTQLGVDTSRIVHISADSVEDVFNKQYSTLRKIKENYKDIKILMLWDSLGGTSKNALIDPDSKEAPMEQIKQAFGRAAAEISQGMMLINDIVGDTRTCYLYTNHVYHKMNAGHGDPYETYGGEKPKFYATVRLRLSRVGVIKDADFVSEKDMVIGHKVRVKALKNSMAPYLMERDAVVMGGRGFVNEYTVFDAAADLGVIKKSGAWSTWITANGEEVKFQGFAGFESKVVTHPEYAGLVARVEEGM